MRGICEVARPELEVLYICKLFCSSEALDLRNACVGDTENLYIAQNGQLQVQLPTYTGSSEFSCLILISWGIRNKMNLYDPRTPEKHPYVGCSNQFFLHSIFKYLFILRHY